MLAHLHVKNLALIEEIEVEFGSRTEYPEPVIPEQVNLSFWGLCS